ncbi:Bacteriocin-protection, YdeI or OmpD-Associated [compost metagenome]
MIIPDDLQCALDAHPGATDAFHKLSKTAKKGMLYQLIAAKRPETRQKRIVGIVEQIQEVIRLKEA